VILVQAAWAATRTKHTYLGAKYKRLAMRIGKKKALIAIARKMLVSIYHMLKKKMPYLELGKDYLDNLNKAKKMQYHKKRLEEMGYEVQVMGA
jgi:transposase